MSISDDINSQDAWAKRHYSRSILIDLHRLFGLQYTAEPDGHGITSEFADYRLQPFLDMFAELFPESVAARIAEVREQRKLENASRLVGGPFDGEPIEVSTWGKTFARNVRKGWWAVYKRKSGNYQAHFVGFATSEVKAKTYQLVHATAAAEIKPLPHKPADQ